MKDFLTDFYNKVVNFFQAEKVEGENTKETAKNRLKLVLMQDRSNLEPETMAQLREELIEVISKYIVIDKEALGLNLDGDGESMALMLNIPVVRAKTSEEIQEALKAAKEAVSEEEIEIVEAEENSESENAESDNESDDEEIEETVVEFSEGSIDELDLPCDGGCKCGGCDCKEDNEASDCEKEECCQGECDGECCNEEAIEPTEQKSEDNTEEQPVKKKNKKK